MPLKLLDLPEEILDACIQEVTPSLAKNKRAKSWNIGDAPFSPFPVDVFKVRLVCRLLNRLALPWLWRRVSIVMDLPTTDSREGPDVRFTDARSAWMRQLVEHPELGAHTRIISLYFKGYAHALVCQTLTAILPAFRCMDNLRVVRLNGIRIDPDDVTSEILYEFLRKPNLHTFIGICEVTHVPSQLRHSLINIRRLCVPDSNQLKHLLELTPNVEYLALLKPIHWVGGLCGHPLPWGTLREIEIHENDQWAGILDNFSSWKQRHASTRSPLSEICIDDTKINYADLEQFLMTFSGQPLSRLKLSLPISLDFPLLKKIITMFPHLDNLGLFTNRIYVPRSAITDYIAAHIDSLPNLRTFQWACVEDIVEDEKISMFDLKDVYLPLAKSSQTLDRIQFFYNGRSHTYQIERDEGGGNVYWKEDGPGLSNSLFTSAWHVNNFDHL